MMKVRKLLLIVLVVIMVLGAVTPAYAGYGFAIRGKENDVSYKVVDWYAFSSSSQRYVRTYQIDWQIMDAYTDSAADYSYVGAAEYGADNNGKKWGGFDGLLGSYSWRYGPTKSHGYLKAGAWTPVSTWSVTPLRWMDRYYPWTRLYVSLRVYTGQSSGSVLWIKDYLDFSKSPTPTLVQGH